MKDRRNTLQKELTFEAVQGFSGHPSADDIYRMISAEHSTISKATVYRNLFSLCEEGRIGKVIPVGCSEAHYDHRIDRHCHAHCIKCGRVVDVDVSYDMSSARDAHAMEDGFTILSHELIFEGICRNCRDKEMKNGTEGIKD